MLKRALRVVVCLFLSTPAFAQTLGTITGEVKDSSGASIPGATVTAQNTATNAVRTQQSNEVGAFAFPAMLRVRTWSKLSCKDSKRRRTVWNFTWRKRSA